MLNQKQFLSPHIFTKSLETLSNRDGCGQGLVLAGEHDPNIVVLAADLSDSTKASLFKEKFPTRFIEVGVAEQALATIGSGMASYGKIPFLNSYAIFSPGRNWEQIRTTICLNNVPVKIIGSHAGITVGPDGGSSQALEDIALMRTLPNMIVVVPADSQEAQKATQEIAKNQKPTYLRLTRMATPVFTTPKTPFTIGKAEVLWESRDPKVAIIGCGHLVYEALKAAKSLSESRIGSIVINNHTIKPLDEQTIIRAAKTTGCIVTIEDHQVNGGLGSVVAETLAKNFPTPIEMIGIEDKFGESGDPKELLEKYKLTAKHIIQTAKKVIKRKNNW